MKCVISILAGIAPGNVHLAGSQVNHDGIDRLFTIKGITLVYRMVADRVGEIDMIAQYGLQ